MKGVLLLVLALLLLADSLQASGRADPLQLVQALRLIENVAAPGFAEPGERLPGLPSGAWQAVALPDVNMSRSTLPGDDAGVQTTWYRLQLPASVLRSAVHPSLYLPRWQTVGQVAIYLDGELLWRSTGDPVWNGFNQPVLLEPGSGGGGPRELVIRMDSLQGLGGGISTLWLGEEDQLIWRYWTRSALQSVVPPAIGVAFLALGLFTLAIWVRRRHEVAYLLFFFCSLFYLLRSLHYIGPLDTRLIASSWFGWFTVNSIIWLAITGLVFNFRLSGYRYRWLETGMLVSTLSCAVLTLPWLQSSSYLASIGVVAHLAMLVFFILTIPLLMGVVWRDGVWTARAMALLYLLAIPLAAHDLALQNYWLSLEQPYLLPYWEISFCLLFASVLLQRYLYSIDGLERSQEVLALRLAERESELRQTYQQLREAERLETLADERRRLMRDMHDGLGSTLVGALRMASAGQGTSNDIEHLLRDCIDELKLTIDSLDPVEADLTLLLATLRHRLQPRLEAAGLAMHWQVQALPGLPWLSPGNSLHVLRILQELVTNIIKHSVARRITVSTCEDSSGVRILVEDDGKGFEPGGGGPAGGRGLANIRSRAQALGAKVEWVAQPAAGTRFSLWLPLNQTVTGNASAESPGTT